MTRAALALLFAELALAACRDDEGADPARVASLSASLERFDGELAEVEQRVNALSKEWRALAEGYEKITATYQAARRAYADAGQTASAASATFQSASGQWRAAQRRWELYREIIELAVAADQRGGASERGVRCNAMSTAAFRKLLLARGVDLVGKDIDHIVPRALGGADDPANYQVLDSSVNRSLGKTWNVEKCLMAGRRECKQAVAISSRCGAYRGGGFW